MQVNQLNKEISNVLSFLTSNGYRMHPDASINVNTGEGVEGYTALFRSRYEKSLRILSLRPESKRITKITSIKQKTSHNSNNMKSDKSYSMTGNFVSNST